MTIRSDRKQGYPIKAFRFKTPGEAACGDAL